MKKRPGFSLIELLICLSLLLLLVMGSVAYIKTSSLSIKKEKELSSLITVSASFMETLKTVPFSSLSKYNNQTLANGKIAVAIIPINSKIYQISLSCGNPKLKIFTLRSAYE